MFPVTSLTTSPSIVLTPSDAIHDIKLSDSKTNSTAISETAFVAIVAGSALASGLVGSAAALFGTRIGRRRTIPITKKVNEFKARHSDLPETPIVKQRSSTAVPEHHLECAAPALCGLAYVDPDVLFSSMLRAYPQLCIEKASGAFALCSATGHNTENQDYGLAFRISSPTLGNIQITIIADGCGGHFGGRAAAYTAVSACIDHLLKSSDTDLLNTAKNCLEAASLHVSNIGSKMWGSNEFRCTLIVLLSNEREYALVHIGDGGADVRREDGTWERLLTPQKEEETGWLTGSLGPTPYGIYDFMRLARKPGDFLVAGTDGIYVDEVTDLEEFWAWPRKAMLKQKFSSNFSIILDSYINECLHAHPDVFDDNVTAMVLATPESMTDQRGVKEELNLADSVAKAKTEN